MEEVAIPLAYPHHKRGIENKSIWGKLHNAQVIELDKMSMVKAMIRTDEIRASVGVSLEVEDRQRIEGIARCPNNPVSLQRWHFFPLSLPRSVLKLPGEPGKGRFLVSELAFSCSHVVPELPGTDPERWREPAWAHRHHALLRMCHCGVIHSSESSLLNFTSSYKMFTDRSSRVSSQK